MSFDDDWGFDDSLRKQAEIRNSEKNQPHEAGIDDFFSDGLNNGGLDKVNNYGNADFGVNTGGSDWNSNFGQGGLSNQQPNQNANHMNPDFKEQMAREFISGAKVTGVKLYGFMKHLYPYIKRVYKDPFLRKKHLDILVKYSALYFAVSWVISMFMTGVFLSVLYVPAFMLSVSFPVFVINYFANYKIYSNEAEKQPESGSDFPDYPSGVSETHDYDAFQNSFEGSTFESSSSDSWGDDGWETDSEPPLLSSSVDTSDDEWGDDDGWGDDSWESSNTSLSSDDDDFWSGASDNHSLIDTLSPEPVVSVTKEQMDSVVDSVVDLPKDLVSRRLLLDKYLAMLDGGGIEADFVKHYDTSHRNALDFTAGFNEAQRAINVKDADLSNILKMTERAMVWELSFEKRSMTSSQVVQLEKEFNTILRKDHAERFGKDVYSRMTPVGSRVDVTIFKGVPALVYLKDIISKNRDFFEDEKNILPVTIGFNEKGEAILVDMAVENSSLISGKPRSGKSNLAKVIINQLIALNSPEQVEFRFGDVKGLVSDWKDFTAPHIKVYTYEPTDIIAMLREIVDYEAPRRAEIIGSERGVLKIQDYNKRHPEKPLPYLFIVLDEIVAFSKQIDEDQKKEYRSLLGIIASQFPAHGIYLLAIPHFIHNDFIEKTTTRNLPMKIAVKFSLNDLDSVFGKDAKGFNYELKNLGDYAYVNSAGSSLSFGHAPVLMSSDKGVQMISESQRRMWSSLYPDHVATSYYYQRQQNEQQEKVMDKIFGGSPDGYDDSWLHLDD